ncbi:MAG: UDP-N-acetylglucosamine 2-epimerase (non-hydrolyzing) [Coriobacteriia bacterium]|nr:UDP-N-acetylglucosamine 2-epimerase (non-hydrolyzing) [Coriobacteriia bacterium]
MKIISVVGARPNFIKIAPFVRAVKQADTTIEHILVHTGQHYDDAMSQVFFSKLNIPMPDINLGIGSGTHAEQIGATMTAFEQVLLAEKPDWVVVVGDVNATVACSQAAAYREVRVAHIEAGLRSYDRSMPEEINRVITDTISDLLLTPDVGSSETLAREGHNAQTICFVGNIMIDTLNEQLDAARALDVTTIVNEALVEGQVLPADDTFADSSYAVATLHRPANVDDPLALREITEWLTETIAGDLPMIWPLHPRTQRALETAGLLGKLLANPRIILTKPVGYREMLRLNLGAALMITDSGGLQEECCVLGTPFLVVRPNTERPITLVEHGGLGVLAGTTRTSLDEAYTKVRAVEPKPHIPPLWDGQAATRCVEAIVGFKTT